MYSALHLPDLPLRAATMGHPEKWPTPLAIVSEGARNRQASLITCLNPAARRAGLHPGLSTARAMARCPHLHLLPPNPEGEQLITAKLIELAQTLSPDLELTAPDTIILARRGTRISALPAEHLHLAPAHPVPLPLVFASAKTPDLAHLLACTSRQFPHAREVATPSSSCSSLPLHDLLHTFSHHFDPPSLLRDLHHTLALWGLETIGEFISLPRADLLERLSPPAALLHDIATGTRHRLLTLYRPPKKYRQHLDLDFAIETLDQLLLLLRNFLHTLCSRLRAYQRVPASLGVTLYFDNSTTHQSDLRIPEPTTDVEPLLRIIHTHLEALTAPAPVIALTLEATPTRPLRAQTDLFQKHLRDPNQFAHTLNQLTALLGADNLGTPQPHNTHRPDQFTLLPPESLFGLQRQSQDPRQPDSKLRRKAPPQPAPAIPCSIPLRRLRPPVEVAVLSSPFHEPEALRDGPYPGPLEAISGPFRLNGHWWQHDTRWQIEEWDVLLHSGPLARLSRTPPHQWHLQGYY
ncbi:MAG: DNA polymerase Y family protein [Verrucomicrobiota bacterium JB023]|nr:DNA polymerase Y family protein [Verrucomicrobiota bacterium JB023]